MSSQKFKWLTNGVSLNDIDPWPLTYDFTLYGQLPIINTHISISFNNIYQWEHDEKQNQNITNKSLN